MAQDRTKKLTSAMLLAGAQNKAAKKQNRVKARKRRPWTVLQEEWFEEIARVFEVKLSDIPKWAEAEKALARKLLKEVDVDGAIEMQNRFVERQHGRGEMPAYKLFWSIRGSLSGKVKKPEVLREYDPESAKKHPKIGW